MHSECIWHIIKALRGVVKVHTGGDAAYADKPANPRFAGRAGGNPGPTVTVRMVEAVILTRVLLNSPKHGEFFIWRKKPYA